MAIDDHGWPLVCHCWWWFLSTLLAFGVFHLPTINRHDSAKRISQNFKTWPKKPAESFLQKSTISGIRLGCLLILFKGFFSFKYPKIWVTSYDMIWYDFWLVFRQFHKPLNFWYGYFLSSKSSKRFHLPKVVNGSTRQTLLNNLPTYGWSTYPCQPSPAQLNKAFIAGLIKENQNGCS